MSAYMCSDRHLTALAAYAVRNNLAGVVDAGQGALTMVAEVYLLLWRENMASLDARYPGDDTKGLARPGPIDNRAALEQFPLLHIIKACHCYAYQACEHTGWERSRAKKLVELIEAHAVRKLPGYDAAPWGL